VWIGQAVKEADYRRRVFIATKCSPGDGGFGLGEFRPDKGFGVRKAEHLEQVFKQSLKRLGLPRVDYYHMWTTHTRDQFNRALAPGGWYDGVMSLSDKWDHLGLTTHADSKTAIEFLETGKFETVTIPLNVVNRTRLDVVDYCSQKGIKVIAMNPLSGGFLAVHDELKELALRYLMRLDNVHILIGFSSVEEVEYARWIADSMSSYSKTAPEILERVEELINTTDPRCTGCGYCQPCPREINVGAALSYYNIYKYMGIEKAKEAFNQKQWESGLQLNRCESCGICESRCPNKLPVTDIIRDANKIMYNKPSIKSLVKKCVKRIKKAVRIN